MILHQLNAKQIKYDKMSVYMTKLQKHKKH
jgi:hypothetical protein